MLDGENGDNAVADIAPVEVFILLLQVAKLSGVLVHHAGERRFKTCDEGAAVHDIDAVAVGIDLLGIVVRVLEGDFHFDIAAFSLNIDRFRVELICLARQIGNKAFDALRFLEYPGFARVLVCEGELQPAVQIGDFFQPFADCFLFKIHGLENCAVRVEGDAGAGVRFIAFSNHGQQAVLKFRNGTSAVFIFVPEDFPFLADFYDHPRGERVHDGGSHAVQSSGNLVGGIAEFAACVQDGVDNPHSRYFFGRMDVGRHAASVVRDGDSAVLPHDKLDSAAVACKMLVNTIIQYFPDQVMEPPCAGASYVHAGTLAHSLQPLKYNDLISCIRFHVTSHSAAGEAAL